MVEEIVSKAMRLAGLPDENRIRQILSEHALKVLKEHQMEVSDENHELYSFALACFTLSSALPAIHTFYIEDAPRMAKQYADADMVFLSPSEVEKQVAHYERLGQEAIFRLKGGGFDVQTIP